MFQSSLDFGRKQQFRTNILKFLYFLFCHTGSRMQEDKQTVSVLTPAQQFTDHVKTGWFGLACVSPRYSCIIVSHSCAVLKAVQKLSHQPETNKNRICMNSTHHIGIYKL